MARSKFVSGAFIWEIARPWEFVEIIEDFKTGIQYMFIEKTAEI